MKKFIFKMFVGGLVFFGTGFLLFFLVKARNGLQVSPGDKLQATKRNELVNNVTTLQTQVTALSGAQSNVQSSIPKAWSVNSTSYVDLAASSAAWTDIPGFSQTITLDKASKVLISGMGDYFCQGSYCHIRFGVNVDGSQSESVVQMGNTSVSMWRNTWGVSHFANLSAGTHVIKIQTWGPSDTGAHICGFSGYPDMNCTMHIMAFPN